MKPIFPADWSWRKSFVGKSSPFPARTEARDPIGSALSATGESNPERRRRRRRWQNWTPGLLPVFEGKAGEKQKLVNQRSVFPSIFPPSSPSLPSDSDPVRCSVFGWFFGTWLVADGRKIKFLRKVCSWHILMLFNRGRSGGGGRGGFSQVFPQSTLMLRLMKFTIAGQPLKTSLKSGQK